MKICFIMDQNINYFANDVFSKLPLSQQILHKKLIEERVSFTYKSWGCNINELKEFSHIVFRGCIDYCNRYLQFKEWLLEIKTHNLSTINNIDIIINNIQKKYLLNLPTDQLISLSETIFVENLNKEVISNFLNKYSKIIVKPQIGAGSSELFLINSKYDKNIDLAINHYTKHNHAAILQPFIEGIVNGEISYIYFNGVFSHAIKKQPKQGEIRCHNNFGGQYLPIIINDDLDFSCKEILSKCAVNSNYARVDFIPSNNKFFLMEIEMIEPDLYFDCHDDAADNYLKMLRSIND